MGHKANVSWRGIRVCSCIISIIEDMFEPRMRAEQGWSSSRKVAIYQGCYNAGGVSASAGTHDAGGAIDTEKLNDAATKIARECGTTSWQRGSPEDSYFDDHNHWIWIGCPDLSSGAADQVVDYKNGRDGLADGYSDKSPHVPYITWQDALAEYNASKGPLGMSTPDHFSGAAPQTIARNGEWHTLKLNDDDALSFLSGPKDLYFITTSLGITGLGVGEVAQVRYVRVLDYSGDKATTIESKYPISEIIGTSGTTFGTPISWFNNIGGKEGDGTNKIRMMILAPNEPTPPADVLPVPEPLGPITVESLVARVTY